MFKSSGPKTEHGMTYGTWYDLLGRGKKNTGNSSDMAVIYQLVNSIINKIWH